MKDARIWLQVVALAYESNTDSMTKGGVTVRRVMGGANNALYRIEVEGGRYACKLCVEDSRQRAAHEFRSLTLLHQAGLDIAPKPLWLDESCTIVRFPVVMYHWLPGSPLEPPLSTHQLALLLDSFQRVHAIRPDDVDSDLADSWWHWFDFSRYLDELDGLLNTYGPWLATTDPGGRDLRDRLAQLVDGCGQVVRASDVDPAREHVTVGLCRVDANLANTVLGADGRLRWVDWEFCGWGDLALDLADMRWHAALAGLSETEHRWVRDNYRRPDDDPKFDERLAVWDRIIATRWPFLILRRLWSLHHGPDRVRLTPVTADRGLVRLRLAGFIERAEQFAGKP